MIATNDNEEDEEWAACPLVPFTESIPQSMMTIKEPLKLICSNIHYTFTIEDDASIRALSGGLLDT